MRKRKMPYFECTIKCDRRYKLKSIFLPMTMLHTEEKIIEHEIEPEIKPEIKPEIQKEYTLNDAIHDATEHILRSIIFWESDDKKVGIIIQMIHHAFIYGIILWYFYIHIFSNSYLQLVLLTCIWFLVWLQHLCCGACLFFNIECRLIGNHTTMIDHIFHLCNIPTSDDMKNGVLFMISSVIMCMLSCEVFSRTILGIKDCF
jgi:hypothetical protein